MIRVLSAIVALVVCVGGAKAENQTTVETLFDALGFPEIMHVMREEGIGYGKDLQVSLMEGRGGSAWVDQVTRIYDIDTMNSVVLERMGKELAEEDIAPMLAFFTSDLGKRIVKLEVSGRRAIMDEDIEAASKDIVSAMREDGDGRLEILEDFIEATSLVDHNVIAALNSNFAFYLGLADGGALPVGMTEDDILADVWSQEGEIRSDTEEWLYAYLVLTFQPLGDDEVMAYTTFFETPEGSALNRAIFVAFDELFVLISEELGLAASAYLAGEEL